MAITDMRIGTLALVAVVVLPLCSCSSDRYGAEVILQNVSATPLHSVAVRVTGNSYYIGELGATETRAVKTYPTGESHIVIEHIDESGQKKELPINCYFEPGYESRFRIKLTAESAVRTE